jgi:hypothetical protein
MLTKSIIIVCLILLFLPGCSDPPTVSRLEAGLIDTDLEPLQDEPDREPFEITTADGTFTVTPVAYYEIGAQVASTESYSSGWQGELAPVDLALIWGDLAKEENRGYVTYSQRSRWYFYRYSGDCPFDNNYIIAHSANTHVIPASDNIRRALKSVEEDDRVVLEGYLVKVLGYVEGRKCWWNTSTSRTDTGDGSCEVLYAESLRINDKVFL